MVASLPKWGKKTWYSDRTLLFTGGRSGRCRQRRIRNAWSGPSEATCSEDAVGEKKLREGGGCWTRRLQGSWLMTHRPGECLWVTVLQSGSPEAWFPSAGQKEGRRLGWPGAEDALPLQKWSLIFKQNKRRKILPNGPSHLLELFQLKHQTQKTLNIKVFEWRLYIPGLFVFCFLFLYL